MQLVILWPWQINEQVWNISRVIVTEENWCTWCKSCPTVTLSTTNTTWNDLGSNPSLCGERSVTNHFSHGMARHLFWGTTACFTNSTWQLCRYYFSFCHFRNRSELINPYSEIKGKVPVGTSWNSSSFVLSQGKMKTGGTEITNCCNCFSSFCSHYLWNQHLSLWTYYSWHFVWHRFILIKFSVWPIFFFFLCSQWFCSCCTVLEHKHLAHVSSKSLSPSLSQQVSFPHSIYEWCYLNQQIQSYSLSVHQILHPYPGSLTQSSCSVSKVKTFLNLPSEVGILAWKQNMLQRTK